MSSPLVADVTYLQDQASRRKRTHQQVFGAAAAILDARAELSLDELAARAHIAPAAVCAHFPTVDAVLAELYLTRLVELPLSIDPSAGMRIRVSEQLRAITLVLADEPQLGSACAQAMLSEHDAAVAGVRAKVAAEVHRRTAAALGMGAWPEVLDTVETLFWGALLQARSGMMSYHAMADRLDTMLELVLPDID